MLMRPIKPREDYARDIATLNTIATAVKRDERISVEERESVVSDLHRAIKKLMAVELASIDDTADVPPVTVEASEPSESGGNESV
jgi:hypothetical protein